MLVKALIMTAVATATVTSVEAVQLASFSRESRVVFIYPIYFHWSVGCTQTPSVQAHSSSQDSTHSFTHTKACLAQLRHFPPLADIIFSAVSACVLTAFCSCYFLLMMERNKELFE